MKRVITSILGLLLIAASTAGSSYAQTGTAKPKAEKPAAVKPALNAKVLTQKLEKRIDNNMVTMTGLVEAMSNNLGQLHFLRTLCFGTNDQKWREVASDMMTIEAPKDATYRRQLVRAFNAGYYAQKDRYEACSAAVALDVAALSENGRHLATMLGDPYRER